jgi:hypothetical protein
LSSASEASSILLISGAMLITIGLIVALAGLGFTTPSSSSGYYYYYTTRHNITYLIIEASSNYTHAIKLSSSMGALSAKVNITFPSGTSGNVTFEIANITLSQLMNVLGARPLPSSLSALAYLDVIVSKSYTGPAEPLVYLMINVTSGNVVAYFWNSTSQRWIKMPNQTIARVGPYYQLTILIKGNLSGTPVALATPAPVGGALYLHTKSSHLALTLINVGVALIGASAILWVRERRLRSKSSK